MTDNDLGFEYRKFHRDAGLYWNNHANQRQFELAKQLITIASLLLTISATAIISFRGINFKAQPLQSFSLIISWVFILISIVCGLKQFVTDAKYFNFLSTDENSRAKIFAEHPFGKAQSEVNNMKPTPSRSNENWLQAQLIFFYIAIVFITISAIFILSLTVL